MSWLTDDHVISGRLNIGSPCGTPSANFVEIVATGRFRNFAASAARTTATIEPGILLRPRRGQNQMMAQQAAAMPSAHGLVVEIESAMYLRRGKKWAGLAPCVVSPKKSSTCPKISMTAMPVVNPEVTG